MKGCSIDIMEKRNLTRTKIIQYLFHHPATSKSELARDLDLSMPTVLSHIGELLQDGMIAEIGEYASTRRKEGKKHWTQSFLLSVYGAGHHSQSPGNGPGQPEI